MSCLKTASFSLRFESLKSPLEVHGPSTSTSESSLSQLNASEAALPSRCPQDEGRRHNRLPPGGQFSRRRVESAWEALPYRSRSVSNGAPTDHRNRAAAGEWNTDEKKKRKETGRCGWPIFVKFLFFCLVYRLTYIYMYIFAFMCTYKFALLRPCRSICFYRLK